LVVALIGLIQLRSTTLEESAATALLPRGIEEKAAGERDKEM
jgi:hypothetical protein